MPKAFTPVVPSADRVGPVPLVDTATLKVAHWLCAVCTPAVQTSPVLQDGIGNEAALTLETAPSASVLQTNHTRATVLDTAGRWASPKGLVTSWPTPARGISERERGAPRVLRRGAEVPGRQKVLIPLTTSTALLTLHLCAWRERHSGKNTTAFSECGPHGQGRKGRPWGTGAQALD